MCILASLAIIKAVNVNNSRLEVEKALADSCHIWVQHIGKDPGISPMMSLESTLAIIKP